MQNQPIFLEKFRYLCRQASSLGYWNLIYRYFLRGLHKITKTNQRMTLSNGVKMTLPHNSQFGTELFLKRNKLDWGSETIFNQFLDFNKDFIDVGANIGYYSLLAAPLSREVYSFEPDPRVIKPLEKNLLHFLNCKIFQEALFSEPGEMTLSLDPMSELSSMVKDSQGDKITVKVNTLDNLMVEHPSLRVSCIKTDAEGADFNILQGGKNLFMRDRPLILSEVYPNAKLFKFIKSIDYTCFAFARSKAENTDYPPAKFIKIDKQVTKQFRLKMIFLVPNRLLAKFEELTVASK